jgi:hypothetical protein
VGQPSPLHFVLVALVYALEAESFLHYRYGLCLASAMLRGASHKWLPLGVGLGG